MRKAGSTKRLSAMLLTMLFILSAIPGSFMGVMAAEVPGDGDKSPVGITEKVSDPGTMDQWKLWFGKDVKHTEYAGGVWTDKTVLTNADALQNAVTEGVSQIQGESLSGLKVGLTDEDNFLVVLSAIANNKLIHGSAHVPTDTMLILDVSSSMNKQNNNQVRNLVNAANSAMKALFDANPNNRVGVVLYSGKSTQGNSQENTATLLFPLGRYTHSNDRFIAYTDYDGEYVSVNSNVYQGNNRVPTTSKRVVGGTYIQNGIYQALKEFLAVEDTTLEDGTTRVPVFVLMSDGAPTAGTTNYNASENNTLGTSNVGDGSGSGTAALSFLTQLTAAYAKAKVDEHYEKTTPLFYTAGLEVGSNNYALAVMNATKENTNFQRPWNGSVYATLNSWWEDLIDEITPDITYDNERINIGSNNSPRYVYTTPDYITSTNQRLYVDKYFQANATGENSLENAFNNIVSEIILQSEYLPTAVHGHVNYDGYITFVDDIGEYMEVKDVKGFIIGDVFYSGATFAQNFSPNVSGLGNLGTDVNNLTELGEKFLEAIQTRLNIEDAAEARELARLAIEYGQLSYTSPTEFSSVIKWYADDQGHFLGFYDEEYAEASHYENAAFVVSSYGYMDTTKISDEAGNLLFCSVNVMESLLVEGGKTVYEGTAPVKTGEQSVRWMIPASMIPLVTREFSITGDSVDDPGEVTMEGDNADEVDPIRLVYEVGLIDGIYPTNVHDIVGKDYKYYNESTGTYAFYTNRWNADQVIGGNAVAPTLGVNTAAVFVPNTENERYYFTENTPIYTKNGNTYTKYTSQTIPTSGEYYVKISVFDWSGAQVVVRDVYERVGANTFGELRLIDGIVMIPKGTMRSRAAFADAKDLINYAEKTENKTGTLKYSYYLTQEDRYNNHYVDSVLGNNGKITFAPTTALYIDKVLTTVKPGDSPTFTFKVTKLDSSGNVDSSFDGEYIAIHTDANGVRTPQTVTFVDGVVQVSIKGNEKIQIADLEGGWKFKVEEILDDDAEYEFTDVSVRPLAQIVGETTDKVATVELIEHDTVHVSYTNEWDTDGELIIRKRVTHPFGSSYVIPATITFDFVVYLDATHYNDGDTVNVTKGSATSSYTVSVDDAGSPYITIAGVKHNESVAVDELKGGSTVSVKETDIPSGFSSYIDGEKAELKEVEIPVAGSVVMQFENVYEPSKADPVNVSLSGSKNFTGRNWKDTDEFTFRLDWHSGKDGAVWEQVGEIQTVNAQNKTFNFSDALENFNFNAIGTYAFRVSEIEGTIPGVTYDKIIGYFSVVVTDVDMDGKLEISDVTTYNEGRDVTVEEKAENNGTHWYVKTDFYNTYAPEGNTAVDIIFRKELTNKVNSNLVSKEGFRFEIFTKGESGEEVIRTSGLTGASGETNIRLVFDASSYVMDATSPEFTYYVREVIPADADKIPGMEYDENEYPIYIDIVDDTNGGIYAVITTDEGSTGVDIDNNRANGNVPSAEVEFTNVYEPEKVTLTGETAIQGTKVLEGKTLENGKFTFNLYETDGSFILEGETPIDTKTNTDGKFVFKDLTFDTVGTYYYVVTEEVPATNPKDGILYDTTVYYVTVEVADSGKGYLNAETIIRNNKVTDDLEAIEFKNTYSVTGFVDVEIEGTKDVVITDGNYIFAANHFFFDLIDEDGNIVQTVNNSAPTNNSATFRFSGKELTFNEIGEYKFTVKENISKENVIGGFDYDETVYDVVITVSDNGTGGLKAETVISVNGDETDSIGFTNTYDPADTSLIIRGDKDLVGRPMNIGEFTFELYETGDDFDITVDQKPIQTVTNTDKDGTYSFAAIKFDKTGTYYFVVKEDTSVEHKGITYDTTEYAVTVVVTDNAGTLTATATVDGEELRPLLFTNNYKVAPTSWPIDGDKNLEGRLIGANDNFTFMLYETGNDFVINEGQTAIDTTVADTDGRFRFKDVLYGQDVLGGEESVYKYYVVKEDSSAALGGVEYDDSEYHITVKVTDVNAELKAEVVSVAKKSSEGMESAAEAVVFENKYTTEPTEVILGGDKDLTGPKNIAKGDYYFNLYETNEDFEVLKDAVPVQTTQNTDTEGTFAFDKLVFDKAGTYYYVISENATTAPVAGVKYDESTYEVTIVVTDNGEGNLVNSVTIEKDGETADIVKFTNVYTTKPTSVGLHGDKDLVGKVLNAGEFTFLRYETEADFVIKEGQTALDDVTNIDSEGSFVFDAVEYDKTGEYYYVIVEDSSENEPGITYDDTQYNVTVKVTDIGGELKAERTITKDGTPVTDIVFENSYKVAPTVWPISGDKNLSGRDMGAEEFTFNLYEADENFENENLVDTAKNIDKNGSFAFKDRDFDKAGEYFFIVREDTSAALPGVTYDTVEYHITVSVEDVAAQLVTVTSVTKVVNDKTSVAEGIVFNNKYDAEDTSVTLIADKNLTGRDMENGEFRFNLYETGANFIVSDLQKPYLTAENEDADGKAVFETIKYTSTGIHHYVILEDSSDLLPGVTYDNAKYDVTVEIKDVDAKLVAEVTVTKDGKTVEDITFNNTYQPKPTNIRLSGDKDLVGRPMNAGEFTFNLYETNSSFAVSPSAKADDTATVADKEGKFMFNALHYEEAGKYYYVIAEDTSVKHAGITYDDTKYHVTVKVTDIGGQLKAEVSMTDGNSVVDEIIFTNYYKAAPTVWPIGGDKNLTGREMHIREFLFELYQTDETFTVAKDQKPIDEARNIDADGTFRFADRDFDAKGTYYFVVKENTSAALVGVTYDNAEYHITVEVEEDENTATLEAKAVSVTDAEGKSVEAVVFNNKYDVKPTTVVLTGDKNLTGREMKDGEFKFNLYETREHFIVTDDQAPVITTTNTDENGAFTFGAIGYTSVGKHYYVITEDDGSKLGGVIYDNSVYHVLVDVTDIGGQLKADVSIGKDGAKVSSVVFENAYVPTDAEVILAGTKKYTGASLADGQFTFNVYETNDKFEVADDQKPIRTAKNDAEGAISFDKFTYTEEGTYYYLVTEDQTDALDRVTYDDDVFEVTVTVKDDGKGSLVAETDIELKGKNAVILFENVYTPKPTDINVDITAVKTVENVKDEKLSPEGFRFELKDSASGKTYGAVSDKDGIAKFSLTYTESDINKLYEYTLYEINDGVEGVTYSEVVYEIGVKVILGDDNVLKAELTVNDEDVENVQAEFVNIYEPIDPPDEPDNPETGDDSRVLLYLGLFIIFAVAIIRILMIARKKAK
ncbi:MAG: hypothetical protein IKM61_10165 [Eubacteriaceae bacterium]|nr:hypothetical protein [Eubacteriaceae bacterium]